MPPPRSLRHALILAGLLLAVGPARAQLDPPGIDPTHYWSWRLAPSFFFSTFAKARDFSMPAAVTFELDSLQRLVSWASKDNAPVADTTKRYTWWRIRSAAPNPFSGVITNQRGDFAVDLFEPRFLLVPATKHVVWAPPANRNPYLCYRALGPTPTGTYHVFRDEWNVDFQLLGPLEYVCVPCRLEYEGTTLDPVDASAYLTAYSIGPSSETFIASLADPLIAGSRSMRQRPFEHAMLPSVFRITSTPARATSWGRIKSIYR